LGGQTGADRAGLDFEHVIMLRWALFFLVLAIIAEVLGFSGAAGEAAWIAHVLFVIAIIFLIISFVTSRRGTTSC
jgi:uncharacterized membrane protein YtjA (UPF0391 family)